MRINTRRNFVGKIAAMAVFVTGAPKLFAQQAPAAAAPNVGSAPAAITTHSTGSTISLGRVLMTVIPRRITSS